MHMDRTDVIDRLRKIYSCYYDIEDIGNDGLIFTAEFHSTSEKFILVKSARLWSENDNEYVYVFSGSKLDEIEASAALNRSRTMAEAIIDTGGDHRTSDITTIFVYDEISESARHCITKYKYHRSYKLYLHGWTDHRTAALETATGRTFHNRLGKKVCDNLTPKVNG